MKKLLALIVVVSFFVIDMQAQATVEYKVITAVESVVPGGLGRSRIVEEQSNPNSDNATTSRTDGKKSNQGDVKRKGLKVDHFDETKLLNFFSLTGINFQNIASNDALIADKLNRLTEEGWEIAFVTSGVESNAGADDGEGIFITRFIMKRNK